MRKVMVWEPCLTGRSRLVWFGAVADVGYWHNQWSRLHLGTAIVDAERHPILHDLFLRYSRVGGRVLEGGCGLGQWVAVLREQGRSVVGLDYDVATLRTTRGDARGADLPLLGGDVRDLPFPNGSFDTYISLGVAEHFRSGPQPLLAEAHRVLRPGGRLLITVPYFNPLRRLRARVGGYPVDKAQDVVVENFYQYAFRPQEFAGHLAQAGFRVEEVVPFAASTGLREDFPLLSRPRRNGAARRAASATTAPLLNAPAATSGGRQPIARRSVAQRLIHARLLRWCSGHMVLFVARRNE